MTSNVEGLTIFYRTKVANLEGGGTNLIPNVDNYHF
jgi:hypothetical protein